MENKKLNDRDLMNLLKEKIKNEKALTLEIVNLIREVENRRIYLTMGFGSLFDFVTKELGYEESAAVRRISVARLIREIPEIENKIANADLNLTNLSMAQSFFRREEKLRDEKLTRDEKKSILEKIENKSTRETQKVLLEISPESAKQKETTRQISNELTQLKIVIDQDLKIKLEKLKMIYSHKNPNMSYVELLGEIADLALRKLGRNNLKSENLDENKLANDKVEKKKLDKSKIDRDRDSNLPPAPQVKNHLRKRYIASNLKNLIWKRDKGCCTFTDPLSGRKCGTQFQLEVHHIHPFAMGGSHAIENLTLLCKQHNNLMATRDYGIKKMIQYSSCKE